MTLSSLRRRGRGTCLPRTLGCALLILTLCGCPAATAPTQPAPQSVDLTMAKSLLVAQTAIEQTKTLIPTHPTFKDQLNQVIAGYNLAEAAYLSFHVSLANGENPDPSAVQARILDIMQKAQALAGSIK